MKIHQITEAPIEDYQLIGDFSRGHSFRHATDRRLVSSPRYGERIKQMFAKTDVDIRMFFVNSTEALIGHAAEYEEDYPRRAPYVEEGEISMAWLQQHLPQGLRQIEQQGGFNPDGINIIFTNNSGAERRPMTGWIIAHRMGHAVLRSQLGGRNNTFFALYDILQRTIKQVFQLYNVRVPQYKNRGGSWYDVPRENYDSAWVRRLLAQIGTFRSARENNLRTAGEFIYECFAQFLITGDIRFNQAPQSMVTGYAWGRPQSSWGMTPEKLEAVNEKLEWLRQMMLNEFENALHGAVGKIYLM